MDRQIINRNNNGGVTSKSIAYQSSETFVRYTILSSNI